MPSYEHFDTYFGFDRMEMVPLNSSIWPPLETKVIDRTAHWVVTEDELGGLVKTWTDREIGMSQWLKYPVKDRLSWEKLKERLNPDLPCRYPEYWEHVKRSYRERDFPLGIYAGSYYGLIRNWIGMENLALLYYDDPELIHEMTEYQADFTLRLIKRALDEIPDLDYAFIWEDMAMKTGPLISPKLFRDFMLEPMKRVTRILKQAGIDFIMVDCDGKVDELIPLGLEADVNMIFPLEVAADCDARRYRRQFGRSVLLMGNIDKRALREQNDKRAIEREVVSKVSELVEEGGFSPMIDHNVPPDVPYEHFKYYVELLNELCTFS